MKYLLLLAFALFTVTGCSKKDEPRYGKTSPGSSIYKLRDTNYLNYIPAQANDDFTKIVGHFGPDLDTIDPCKRPILLDSSYFFESDEYNSCVLAISWSNPVILDIKRVDNKTYFNSDTMVKHILDRDPFIELYFFDDSVLYHAHGGYGGLNKDTALLNSWIRKGELSKHMKRYK